MPSPPTAALGHRAVSEDLFGGHSWGGHLVGAEHPTVLRAGPMTRREPVPAVRSWKALGKSPRAALGAGWLACESESRAALDSG